MVLTVFNVRGRQNSALPGLTTYIDKDEGKLNMELVKLADYNPV